MELNNVFDLFIEPSFNQVKKHKDDYFFNLENIELTASVSTMQLQNLSSQSFPSRVMQILEVDDQLNNSKNELMTHVVNQNIFINENLTNILDQKSKIIRDLLVTEQAYLFDLDVWQTVSLIFTKLYKQK